MSAARQPASLDDFIELVGHEFVGVWFSIAEDRQQQFFEGSYLDLTYGTSLGPLYPDGLVEGFHQLALLDYLSADVIGRWHGFNYGLNRVRFVSPVTIHERMRLRLKVTNAVRKNDGVLVTYDAQLEIEHKSKPSLIAEWLVLLLPESSLGETTSP